MKFYNFLNEKRGRSVIVVDVQPMYKNYIRFDINKFNEFLNNNGKILYFFNGPDSVGVDTKNDIISYLTEEYYDDDKIDDYYHKLNRETKWVDKGYGFFRG